jgi:hypothetical protein
MQGWLLYQLAWETGFRRGQLTEARKILRMLGDKEFGPPHARIVRIIERLTDLEQLEDLAMRVRTARNWPSLLGPLLPGYRKETGTPALTQCPKVRPGRRRAMPSLPHRAAALIPSRAPR